MAELLFPALLPKQKLVLNGAFLFRSTLARIVFASVQTSLSPAIALVSNTEHGGYDASHEYNLGSFLQVYSCTCE